jgi:hypothetical protein
MIELLGYSAISLLVVKYFSPLEPLRLALLQRLVYLSHRSSLRFLKHLISVVSCVFCFSFWFTLAMTFSLASAAIVSILTMILDLIIENLRNVLHLPHTREEDRSK